MTPAATVAPPAQRTRRGVRVRGTVQGVGMRPAVFRLATELRLGGLVRNDSQGVWIEVEGAADALVRFIDRLVAEVPALGHIDQMDVVDLLPAGGSAEFVVDESRAIGQVETAIPADAATCDDCAAELFDPADRRYRYPFINCTRCGPRYTIIRDLPYDRARTTMSGFAMCARCRVEYADPRDRRFRAEASACPACGPRLAYREGPAPGPTGEAALAAALARLGAGGIVAVKGLGGFHLAVDAAHPGAVARLRARKQRPDRPFAVMVRSIEAAERIAEVGPAAAAALLSPARPIALLPLRAGAALAGGVAPRLVEVGVMLPYTPLHHLLVDGGPPVLVMTSGNRAGEPIVGDNDDARSRLAGIADGFLDHDRDIHTRADDSVVRPVAGVMQSVRRSRGWVPRPILLEDDAPPICAVGAELKNTVCLTRGREAFLSPHVGDLRSAAAHDFFAEVIEKLGRLLGVAPAVVAHDLHPDYGSTRWALAAGLPREPVQHHHAHIASCLVDNGRTGPVLGVAFDGTGCGPAGDLWGGEFLRADLAGFTRLAHLRPLPLPGGEAAIREPWRQAAAALLDAGLPIDRLRAPAPRLRAIARLCETAPAATGAGRWFDAVAALCGVRDAVSYEAQAAIELEAIAAGAADPYPFEVSRGVAEGPGLAGGSGVADVPDVPDVPDVYDLRPVIRAIAADLDRGAGAPLVAARFHRTLAEVIAEAARRWCGRLGLTGVALSGGCFQNRLLTETAARLLEAEGLEVLLHRRVPPNDGGVALGQAAVAAHRHRARQNGSAHVSGHTG